MSSFNSTVFSVLISKLKYSHAEMNRELDNLRANTYWASNSYRSSDSNISEAFKSITETLNDLRIKTDITLTQLQDGLNKYMIDTIANETEAASNLHKNTSAIEEIKANIGRIV